MKKLFLIISIIYVAFYYSCGSPQVPREVEVALAHAPDNRTEILTVLKHYAAEKDSLKLKAAYFLIKNLDTHYYLSGSILDNYMDYAKLVLRDPYHGEYIMNSFGRLYGNYAQDSLKIKKDLQHIKASEMISNIDAAFTVWQNQPWGKNYSFNQFCNYILPFRVGNEVPEYNRLEIYKKYCSKLNDKLRQGNDAVTACAQINDELIKEGWLLTVRDSFLPHSKASKLLNYRLGSCREMSDLGLYVMRSLGIPVAIDFLPQWPYRRQGHTWNVVFNNKGKAVPFLGAEDSPGTPHRPGTKRGKVYRLGFAENKYCPANIGTKDDFIPEFLTDKHIFDVTSEYAKVHTVNIDFQKSKYKIGYLSVFNNTSWSPIAWSPIEGQKVKFSNVEGGIVFLPSFYTEYGNYPAQAPFILTEQGQVRYLIPDTANKIAKLTCNRVYPIVAESYQTDQFKGGKVQGANRADFADAKDLYKFNVRALPGWNEIAVSGNNKFRYLRVVFGVDKKCKIAELQAFSIGGKLDGKVFSSVDEENDIAKKAIDGDELTAYESNVISSALIIDLGKTSAISKIRLMAKIDIPEHHLIIPNKKYELKMWFNGRWNTIARQKASSNTLSFSNVPSNSLFLLNSDTQVNDTRIFTYENGKQIWW